jgi:hypothetical protein
VDIARCLRRLADTNTDADTNTNADADTNAHADAFGL